MRETFKADGERREFMGTLKWPHERELRLGVGGRGGSTSALVVAAQAVGLREE